MVNILILEDETSIGQFYQKKLQDAGHCVEWACTIQDIKSCIKHFTPDVFILDHKIRAEHQSGSDLISSFRKDFPSSFIIMFSNYNSSKMRTWALQNGADLYCIKIDTSPQELIRLIEHHLQRGNST